MRRFLPDALRPAVVASVLMGGAGLVLAFFVPGVDAPNYYSALVLSLLGGLVSGPVGVLAGRRALAQRKNPFVAALHAVALPALLPLLVLLLNGARVQQCDVWSGVFFYLLGPPLTCAFAAALGAALAALAPLKKVAIPLFYLVWLGWVFADLWHLYREPAIFAYNPFAGFFSGAVYDTVIEIDHRIVLYRLNNLAFVLMLVALVRLAWDRQARRLTFAEAARAGIGRWVTVASAVGVVLAFWAARGEIGYEVGRAQIVAELGGRIAGPRLVLVYDKEHILEAEAQSLYEDHLYRLDQLEAKLGRHPRPITSYVYGTNDQKRRLMGAGQVYIAKPWLDEIHLNRVPYGHSVVTHELAHVVLGNHAPAPFHIPTTFAIPQMALVEGAAEAFEWDTGALTPHQWACAMRAAKLAPPLNELLGPDGFYKQSGDKAYTLAGSFIRWLMDTHGPERFELAYADGAFERVYQTPLPELVAGWERYVDALEVPDDAAGLATGRYTQVAIFYRTCGLDVARTEAEAGRLLAAGDRAGARAAYQQVVDWLPDDPQKRIALLQLAVGDKESKGATTEYVSYMALPRGRNPVSDALATELMGDALWRDGHHERAARLYATVADTPAGEERRRTVLVKVWASAEPGLEVVMDYLLDGQIATLERVRQALPQEPFATYLAGRRAATDQRHAEAIPLLEKFLDDAPRIDPTRAWRPWVVREAWRLLGLSRFQVGDYARAAAAFEIFAGLTPYGGDRDRYLDWAERARWKSRRAADGL